MPRSARPLLLPILLCLLLAGGAFAQTDPILDTYRQAQQLATAGDFHQALEKARQSLQLGEGELGAADPRLAPLLNEMATLLYRLGRYDEAATHFERALRLKRQSLEGNDPQLALALTNLASAWRALGRLVEAENLQRQALLIDRRIHGPDHLLVAEDLNNLAAILQERGEYASALDLLGEALAILEKDPAADARRLAGLHNNIGLLYKLQGRFPSALSHYEQALRQAEGAFGDEHPAVARIAANLAILYRETGDIRQAELRFRQAVEICRREPAERFAETAMVLNGFAALLAGQDRLPEARNLYLQALQLQSTALGAGHGTVAVLYNNLGELELRNGDLPKAREYLLQARDIWVKGEDPPEIWLAAVHHNLGRLHARQGRSAEAEAELRRALQLTTNKLGSRHYQNVPLLANLADLLKRRGAFEEATGRLEEALAIAQEHLSPHHPQSAELLNSLGALYFSRNQLAKADDYSRQAAAAVQSRLLRHPADPVERRLLRHILLNRVAVLHQLAETRPDRAGQYVREAFEAAQWAYVSSAGAALDQLAARFAAGDDELARLVRRRQDGLARQRRLEAMLDQRLISPPERRLPHEEREIRAQLTLADQELGEITRQLEQAFPRYAALERPSVIGVAEAQQQLGAEEALVLVLTGEAESYLWWLGRDELDLQRLPLGGADLAARVAELRRGLNQSDVLFAEELRPFDLELSRKLYRELLAPVEPRLRNISRLVTVVDGALLDLPLTVLVRSFDEAARGSEQYRSADWLIDNCSLLRLPTVGGLVQLRQRISRSQAKLPFAGFGDPQLTDLPEEYRGGEGRAAGRKGVAAADVRSLPRLPETALELKAVAGLLGATEEHLFLGANATEGRVRAAALDRYRVLAFASHALMAGDLPGLVEPALVLTPRAGEDGLLTAGEIAGLKLDADLVVLSACNTAAADGSARGEGLSGLARAFFYAGSRGVMASHWPVASAATAALMTRFVARWQENRTGGLDRALTAAMRELRFDPQLDLAHPMFWAPFLIVGFES